MVDFVLTARYATIYLSTYSVIPLLCTCVEVCLPSQLSICLFLPFARSHAHVVVSRLLALLIHVSIHDVIATFLLSISRMCECTCLVHVCFRVHVEGIVLCCNLPSSQQKVFYTSVLSPCVLPWSLLSHQRWLGSRRRRGQSQSESRGRVRGRLKRKTAPLLGRKASIPWSLRSQRRRRHRGPWR